MCTSYLSLGLLRLKKILNPRLNITKARTAVDFFLNATIINSFLVGSQAVWDIGGANIRFSELNTARDLVSKALGWDEYEKQTTESSYASWLLICYLIYLANLHKRMNKTTMQHGIASLIWRLKLVQPCHHGTQNQIIIVSCLQIYIYKN